MSLKSHRHKGLKLKMDDETGNDLHAGGKFYFVMADAEEALKVKIDELGYIFSAEKPELTLTSENIKRSEKDNELFFAKNEKGPN